MTAGTRYAVAILSNHTGTLAVNGTNVGILTTPVAPRLSGTITNTTLPSSASTSSSPAISAVAAQQWVRMS
jgi:hypothetical protein